MKRSLHLVYFSISVLVWLTGLIIQNSNINKEVSVGVGDTLHYAGWIFMCILFLLFFFPKKVFSIWKFVSMPFVLYLIIKALKIPIFGDCTPIGCNDRATFVVNGSFVFGIISLSISIILALIWHFVEKYPFVHK